MAGQKNFPPRRDQRRADAEERAEEHANRSPQQQLQLLVDRGHANCAEAEAMQEMIDAGFKQTLGGDSWPNEEAPTLADADAS